MAETNYSIFKVARILGVYPSTVEVWVRDGKLKCADKGESLVTDSALRTFLEVYKMPVPRDFDKGIKPVILVVDDDDMVRGSITNLLRRFCTDAVIITAEGGFEAGQMVSMHVPDLVLLDIMLPGLDGFNTCAMIKKQYSDVKILAITGYGSNENRDRMIQEGADGFLTKPVEAEELLKNVKALLGGECD